MNKFLYINQRKRGLSEMVDDHLAEFNSKIDSFVAQVNRKFNILYWMINLALALNLVILFKLFS